MLLSFRFNFSGDEELIIEGWEAARMGYEEDSDMEYRPNTQPKSKRGKNYLQASVSAYEIRTWT